MIRIELVEDGLPAAVLYANVDAIEEAMLREREAFEWALAREAMSPFSGFQSRLMERLRRVVERRPKLCAALAVAGAAHLRPMRARVPTAACAPRACRRDGVLWSLGCLLLGTPFCCLYVATRLLRTGTLRLSR